MAKRVRIRPPAAAAAASSSIGLAGPGGVRIWSMVSLLVGLKSECLGEGSLAFLAVVPARQIPEVFCTAAGVGPASAVSSPD